MSDTITPRDHQGVRSLDPHQIRAWQDHLRYTHPPTTVHTYVSAIACAARELPYGLLATYEELLAWLATRRHPQTRATYTRALRAFYTWCVETGRLLPDENPAAKLPAVRVPRRQPRPIGEADLEVILTHAREPYRTWMLLLLYGGLRCKGLAGLRREDIDEDFLTIRRAKGDVRRIVPTHPVVWDLVRDLPPGLVVDHTAARYGSHPPSRSPRAAERISDRINREIDRIAAAVGRPGLSRITAHQFRHTAATWWLRATGGDLRATQELLGHASVATTQIYTAVAEDTLRAAVLAMPTLGATAAADATTAAAPPPVPRLPQPAARRVAAPSRTDRVARLAAT